MSVDFSRKFDKMDVLEENKDFLIVEKPAGLLVHKDKYVCGKTLVDLILEKYPEINRIGQPGRSGIVHRLDREVSGLMVIARNKETYDHLIEQFQQRKVKKEYLALVYGHPAEDKGEIDFPLARNKKGKIVAVLYRKGLKQEKEARTGYEVRQKFTQPQEFALLKVFLHTGRTHQIRIHLKSIGHPIVGDEEYGIRGLELKSPLISNRLFLHACHLGFYDPNNVWQEYDRNLPAELEIFLKELK